MSNPLSRRLRRLESRGKNPAADYRRARQTAHVFMLLAQARLAYLPGLPLVIESDTDPETWRSIQQLTAHARGGYVRGKPLLWAADGSQRARAAIDAARRRLALT